MIDKIKGNVKAVLYRILQDIKAYRIPILLFAGYNVLVRKVFKAFCPQLILTGFPCAGCGMTRAVFYILTGRLERGMRLNPAAPLWILFLVWFVWNRYVCGKKPANVIRWLGGIGAVTLMIYIYRMVNCFPGEPPMVYYRDNIIRRLLH